MIHLPYYLEHCMHKGTILRFFNNLPLLSIINKPIHKRPTRLVTRLSREQDIVSVLFSARLGACARGWRGSLLATAMTPAIDRLTTDPKVGALPGMFRWRAAHRLRSWSVELRRSLATHSSLVLFPPWGYTQMSTALSSLELLCV